MKAVQSEATKVVLTDDRDKWLATFFFDNKSGTICIRADFGDVAHSWPLDGRGTDLLTGFLRHCDASYLMDKFSYGRKDLSEWFDDDKTFAKVREDIQASALDEDEKDECRFELDEIEGNVRSVTDWQWAFSTQCETIFEEIYHSDYASIPCFTDYSPQYKAFFEKIWPQFVEFIKSDEGLAYDGPRYTKERSA